MKLRKQWPTVYMSHWALRHQSTRWQDTTDVPPSVSAKLRPYQTWAQFVACKISAATTVFSNKNDHASSLRINETYVCIRRMVFVVPINTMNFHVGTVFSVASPCVLVIRYQHFVGTWRHHLQPRRWRQYAPPKGLYPPTSPQPENPTLAASPPRQPHMLFVHRFSQQTVPSLRCSDLLLTVVTFGLVYARVHCITLKTSLCSTAVSTRP
jgi:hypothetical protein